MCTQDQMHVQPALAALAKGYHVFLEKPIATTEVECRRLVDAVAESHFMAFAAEKSRLNKEVVER